jgi:hypothetical protein
VVYRMASIGSNLVVCALICLTLAANPNGRGGEKTDPDNLAYKMEVSLKLGAQEELLLDVKLTNVSKTPITVYRDKLPWLSPRAFCLTAVQTDGVGTVLKKAFPIVVPGSDKVTIGAGESLTGQVDITHRFPTLQQDRKLGKEVVVFWTYRLWSAPDLTEGERKGGWVPVPPPNDAKK